MFLIFAAGVIHLGLAISSRKRKGYKTTLRCLCYMSSGGIIALLPYLGFIVGFVWGVVVLVLALSAAHNTSRIRAIIAVVLSYLIPWLANILFGLILILLAMALRGSAILG